MRSAAACSITVLSLVAGGCATPWGAGLADPLGGAAIEDALQTSDGKYLVVSTRWGDQPAKPRRWFSVRRSDRRTKLLSDDLDAVARWEDTTAWVAPDRPLAALVRDREIRVFDLETDRVVAVLARGASSPDSTLHRGTFLTELTRPTSTDWEARAFWREFLGTEGKPAPVAVDRLGAQGPIAVGNGVDRYGETTALTTVPGVIESGKSQAYRTGVRLALGPYGVPWLLLQMVGEGLTAGGVE